MPYRSVIFKTNFCHVLSTYVCENYAQVQITLFLRGSGDDPAA